MPPEAEGYAGHRRYYPLFHFVTLPVLTINVLVRGYLAFRNAGSLLAWWDVVVAVILLAFAFAARVMVLTVQDRLLGVEERLRLQRLAPADLQPRLGELSSGQLIALRFCADSELPELTRTVLTEPVYKREEIKKRIRNWRPDTSPRA